MNTPKENLETLKEVASNGYEAAQELGDINLRTWNNMFEKQMDMLNVWLQAGISQVELGSTAKDPKEYLTSQVSLTKELGEKMIAGGRDAISSGTEAQAEYRAWYEKSVQTMTSNWNKASNQAS